MQKIDSNLIAHTNNDKVLIIKSFLNLIFCLFTKTSISLFKSLFVHSH
jgi:hypothetical protein